MSQFIKDFGPAIGPTLGFLFGMLAVYCHDWLKSRHATRKIKRDLNALRKQILDQEDPQLWYLRYLKSWSEKRKFPQPNEVTTNSDLRRLEKCLMSFQGRLTAVEGHQVFEHGDSTAIDQYVHLKYAVDKLIDEVNRVRAESGLGPFEDSDSIRDLWLNMQRAAGMQETFPLPKWESEESPTETGHSQ